MANAKVTDGILPVETEAFLVFATALIVRVAAVLLFPDVTIPSEFVIFGGPVADASHWHQVASEIARGEGVHTSLRPLYSILLALPQQFFGNDVVVAKFTNAFLDSGSILFGYLIFRRLLAAPAPLMIALTLALLPNYVMFSHGLLSEHAGAFFLLAALIPMLSGDWAARWWAVAGLLTGLSNLARPLTLLAIPAMAAVAFRIQGIRFVRPLAAFTIASCLTIAPWMLVQYQRYGIISLSSNTNQVLAAATNPKYQKWSPAVQDDKLAEGVPATLTLKQWDDIFKQDIWRNLREWPLFWPRNVVTNLWRSLNDGGLWLQQRPAVVVALAILWSLCGLFIAISAVASSSTVSRPLLFICTALSGAALATGTWVLLLLAGVVFSASHSRRCTALVIACLVGCMFGHSVFGFSTDLERLGLMYAPLVFGFQAAAFVSVGYAAGRFARLWQSPSFTLSRLAIRMAEKSLQPAWLSQAALATAGVALVIACGRLAVTYVWQPFNPSSTYAATGADPVAAMQQVREDLANGGTGPVMRGRLVVSDFIFPLNYIHVPDALLSKLGAREPVYVFSIGFNGVGWRWTIVSGQNIPSLVGKRFVAVLADGSDTDGPVPELVYLRPFSRILALAPLSRQGVDMRKLTLTQWDCVPGEGATCPAHTTENTAPSGFFPER